jgi:ADP-ribosyl-[dinitrogen reductase] hydrolase
MRTRITMLQHPVMIGLARGDQHGGPTAMANILLESLVEIGNLDIGHVTSRYLKWWQTEGFDTGPIFDDVMSLIDQGKNSEEAVEIIDKKYQGLTAGCNPAHRIAPLSLEPSFSIEQLPELAMMEARISHFHPLAGDVSAAVAILIRALLDGVPFEKAKIVAAKSRYSETSDAILKPDSQPIEPSGFSPDALRAAIHFLNHTSSAEEAIEKAKLFAGGSNYCPVLVGAISGARW